MARVLIVEDDPTVRAEVVSVLAATGLHVLDAATGADGLDLAVQGSPDLVVVDLGLPDTHGIELTRRLRRWTSAPILILSARGEETLKVAALDAGADDYVEKPFGVEELRARVRAQLRRRSGPEDTVLEYGDLVVDLERCAVRRGAEEVRLTPIEWRLLRALATRPGALLSYHRLAREVWGVGDDNRQVARAHVRSLRAKLRDDAAAPRVIRTESGAGYRWIHPPGPVEQQTEPASGAPSGGHATGGPAQAAGGSDTGSQRPADDPAAVAHDLRNALTTVILSTARARRAGGDLAEDVREEVGAALQRSLDAADRACLLLDRLEELAAGGTGGRPEDEEERE